MIHPGQLLRPVAQLPSPVALQAEAAYPAAALATAEATSGLPERVGRLYDAAAPELRRRILDELLAPIDLVSALRVARGIFCPIKFGHAEWQSWRVGPEDLRGVSAADVVALAACAGDLDDQVLPRLADMAAGWACRGEGEAVASGVGRGAQKG